MTYEVTYILKPELTSEEQAEANEAVRERISELGGTANSAERTFSVDIGGTDEQNLRKFAYPIGKYRQGFYYTVQFDLPGEAMQTLEQRLKKDSRLLRHLIVSEYTSLDTVVQLADQREQRMQELQETEKQQSFKREVNKRGEEMGASKASSE